MVVTPISHATQRRVAVDSSRPSPIASAVTLFLVVTYVLAFAGLPLRIVVAGTQTSGLEIAAALAFCFFFFVDTGRQPRAVKLGFVVLLLSALPSTAIGIADNDINRVLRDMAQLVYVPAIFVGIYVANNLRMSVDSLQVRIVYVVSVLAIVYIIDQALGAHVLSARYQFTMRPVASLSVILIFSRLFGFQQLRRASPVILACCLAVLIIYTLENRTRANLLMQAIGLVVLAGWGLLAPVTQRQRGRVIVVLGLIVYGLMAAWLASLVISDFTGHRLDVIPSGGSLARSSDLLRGGIDPTTRYRLDAWDAAISDHPIDWVVGRGMGRYLPLDPLLRGQPELLPAAMIHNTPLQIFYLGGFLHLAGFCLFFYSIFNYAGRPTQFHLTGARVALSAFVAGYLAYSVFSVAFFDATAAIFFWFTLGLMVQSFASAKSSAASWPGGGVRNSPPRSGA